MDRRSFLKSTAVAGACASSMLTGVGSAIASSKKEDKRSVTSKSVPDTLNLADHGSMGINGILGCLNPELDYECTFLLIYDVHPAYLLHWSTMVSGVMPKFIEALPMLRLMSGSDQDMDIEKGFLDAMIRNMSEDGLVYDRALPTRPWNVGVYYGAADWNEDYANMAGNGRAVAGMTFMHQVTGDRKWKKYAKKTAERMLELAIFQDDIAFYPNQELGNDFSYGRKSGWTSDKPPEKATEGFEGATLFYMFQPLRGFVRYYQMTGDERFLDLSRKFVNLGIQKRFWGAGHDMLHEAAAERGHFHGHFHGTLAAIRGLLDYALVANDYRLKIFCRDAYEFARQHGIHRMGIFTHNGSDTEGCTIGDMVGLAATLSLAGLGDYWDDVEQYARNTLICAQATDLEEMRRVSEEGKYREPYADWGGEFDMRFNVANSGALPGQEIHENALTRSIGAFGHLMGAKYLIPQLMHCCTANGNQGIYFAWDGIVKADGESAAVNMWLNRRSPWVDVYSWLPYEGRLHVQNKDMKTINIRIPGWAERSAIRCKLNGKDVEPSRLGNRLIFSGLRGNEKIELEAPVHEETAEYTMVNLNERATLDDQYKCRFKGNTVLEVNQTNPDKELVKNWYRIFRRDDMKKTKAPMKKMDEYVHPKELVDWVVI